MHLEKKLYDDSFEIEKWEIELASKIASSFKSFHEKEDLEADLFKKLLEIKSVKIQAKDWKSFLAKTLFNAAHDYLRRHNRRAKYYQPLEIYRKDDDSNTDSMEESIASATDTKNLDIKIALDKLSPELRNLWDILMEEGGNESQTARRLGKPRTTIKYWIKKLKDLLNEDQNV